MDDDEIGGVRCFDLRRMDGGRILVTIMLDYLSRDDVLKERQS